MMQHMLNNHDQQMGSSSFHPQHPLGPHVLNGGMPVQVRRSTLNIYRDVHEGGL